MNYQIIEDPEFVKLQFSKEWIDLGIITSENFLSIKKEYIKGEDRRTEHYRWGAFRAFLEANSFIFPKTFYRLYNLGKNDPDYSMGRAMIFEIIKRLDCPQELLDTAIGDGDITLAKYALKCKSIRDKSKPYQK
jgi:hypothetical protein